MLNFDELMQKAKDTFEMIAGRSFELYKIAEEKTKLMAKITKLSADITFEKGELRKHYRELGKLYYDLNKDTPEEPFAQSCEEITASLELIQAKQRERDALRSFAEYEPVSDDETGNDETDSAGDDAAESAPDQTGGSFNTDQETDTPQDTEEDAGLGKTPPTFRL